jgi:hypothetical protein
MTLTRYASAYGRVIAIELDDPRIDLPLPYLPFPWDTTSPENDIDRTYWVRSRSNDSYALTIDHDPPVDVIGLELLGDRIEGDVHHWLATFTRGFLFVHAGCVGWRGRGIVLPGRSHAGKTTLTRALVEAGATYYSDDYAVIDPTGAVWPFPRRLYVRPMTPEPPHRIDPVASQWKIGQNAMRAALVAELRFDRDHGWAVECLSSGPGALSLLDNTVAARERPQDALRLMSNVMIGAIAIKGTRGDVEPSARRLLSMVDEFLDRA